MGDNAPEPRDGVAHSPGAPVSRAAGPATLAPIKERIALTWTDVYSAGPALAVPWYVTGGWRDWEGNITAQRAMSVPSTATGSMTWHFPRACAAGGARRTAQLLHAMVLLRASGARAKATAAMSPQSCGKA